MKFVVDGAGQNVTLVEVRNVLLADERRVLRIVFKDGETFRLKACYPIDPTVYGAADLWTATIVEAICGRHPEFERLFRPGSGLDFRAGEISVICDESGAVLYRYPETEDDSIRGPHD